MTCCCVARGHAVTNWIRAKGVAGTRVTDDRNENSVSALEGWERVAIF